MSIGKFAKEAGDVRTVEYAHDIAPGTDNSDPTCKLISMTEWYPYPWSKEKAGGATYECGGDKETGIVSILYNKDVGILRSMDENYPADPSEAVYIAHIGALPQGHGFGTEALHDFDKLVVDTLHRNTIILQPMSNRLEHYYKRNGYDCMPVTYTSFGEKEVAPCSFMVKYLGGD